MISTDVEECCSSRGAGPTACGCVCGQVKVAEMAKSSGPSQMWSSTCLTAHVDPAYASIMKWLGERRCDRGQYASGGAGPVESSSDAYSAANCPVVVVKVAQVLSKSKWSHLGLQLGVHLYPHQVRVGEGEKV